MDEKEARGKKERMKKRVAMALKMADQICREAEGEELEVIDLVTRLIFGPRFNLTLQ